MLIKTNAELREHLGGAVSMSLTTAEGETEDNRILAYVPGAERKYIKKAIGTEIYTLLNAQYNSTEGTAAENKEIFELIQKATAHYAYAEWTAYSAAADGNNGLEADEKKTPKMWQVLERQNKSYELASDSIEEALKLLFEGDFAVFKSSKVWNKTYALLVNSGEILLEALPASSGSYRLFVTLWPYMADVEQRECEQVAGAGTYTIIKAKRNGLDTGITPVQLGARKIMEKLTAHAAYLAALPEVFTVAADGGSIRVYSEFDGIRNRNTPKEHEMQLLLSSIEKKVAGYRNDLKSYLDKHVADFPAYEEERYKGGSVPGFTKNTKDSPIFRLR